MAPSRALQLTLRSTCHSMRSSAVQQCSCRRAHHIQAIIPSRHSTISSSTKPVARSIHYSPPPSPWTRGYASTATAEVPAVEPPDFLDEKEMAIFLQLRDALQPTALEVQDVSGGCGSMYAVAVTSERFKGLPVIKQHRLVNEILKEKIKDWHGMQLRTKAP